MLTILLLFFFRKSVGGQCHPSNSSNFKLVLFSFLNVINVLTDTLSLLQVRTTDGSAIDHAATFKSPYPSLSTSILATLMTAIQEGKNYQNYDDFNGVAGDWMRKGVRPPQLVKCLQDLEIFTPGLAVVITWYSWFLNLQHWKP